MEKVEFVGDWVKGVLGYFPSHFRVTLTNGMTNSFAYNKKNIEREVHRTNMREIRIRFEAKYDDGVHRNTNPVPDHLFHLTPDDSVEKIGNRVSSHPSRIYLFKSLSEVSNLLRTLRFDDVTKGLTRLYSLLKVDLRKRGDVVLHTDPNYLKGFYTYDNVAPHDVEVVETGL